MFEIFKIVQGEVKELGRVVKGCWINLINPSEQELRRLNEIVPIPEEVITSLKDIDEMSDIDYYEDFVFLIIRVPQERGHRVYKTFPFGILLNENFIVTICFSDTDIVSFLKSQRVSTSDPIFVALKIILIASRRYLLYLKELNKRINVIRKELERSLNNEELIRLMDIENTLVYFNTSLKTNEFLVEKIAKKSFFTKSNRLKELIDSIIEENKQAIEMTTIYIKVISGMTDAFSSVISNNLNKVMKFLTSITLILMLPTLVASVYGMNIALPFQHSPHAFLITMLLSFGLSILGVILFWKKKWF